MCWVQRNETWGTLAKEGAILRGSGFGWLPLLSIIAEDFFDYESHFEFLNIVLYYNYNSKGKYTMRL